jgi:threonyl-tRNA synthetase
MSGIIKLTLPDLKIIEAEKGSTAFDVVGKIGKGLQKAALAVKVDGVILDLACIIEKDAALNVITFDSPEGKDIFRHSASHLMAQAVKRLYPGAKIAIGPAIENGFYYDFDIEDRITVEDFEKIEAEMKKIVDENLDIVREDISSNEAIKIFEKLNEPYKAEMIKDLGADTVSIYKQGEFTDLCRGPHLPKTGALKAFKLLSIAGAYWRGDEKNRMLQRIYGTAFPDAKELKKHLDFLEEVKKRDHRKLGKDLDLYSTHEDAGGGLIYWHPKGARIRSIIEEWWRQEHFAGGYEILYTPHVGRSSLWETSGHLGFYSENMYSPMNIDGNEYYVKPMNCPFHIKIYQTSMHSYRDLPLRWAELGTVYRYEKSGVLHGLLRVRGFTQDDAHIFCTESQIESEVIEVLRFSLRMWKILGFTDIKAYLATKPEKSVGEAEKWETAQKSLMKAVESENLKIELDEGGGAFYGPKIDLKVRDSIGREWQMTTIQFDFNEPERFDMYYIGEDGQKQRPYMVHRALLGSLERFFGILIEHYSGKFPVWLAPVQAMLINVSEEQVDYIKEIKSKMLSMGMRPAMDLRNESIGYKIKAAIGQKVPYICVAGNKEVESGKLSVRKRGESDSKIMSIDEFFANLKAENDSKE